METQFDYVVVGAGSSGCAVAARLAEKGNKTLLVEAGGHDKRFWIQVPIGYGRLYYDGRVNWKYKTENDPGLNGRSEYWPRGKVMGGSSSINAMVYIRGQAQDYDDWEADGNPGWSYKDVLPYFRKSEGNLRGEDAYHGGSGPLKVSDVERHPLTETFFQGMREMQIPENFDFNGARQEGYGPYQLTTDGFRRCSSARAFLSNAGSLKDLTIEKNAMVTRILFEGRKAVGIECQSHGRTRQIRVAREVIVSAGAINSPQLLQLSGIGPAGLLQRHGIEVVQDLPGVGRNMQDHLFFPFQYKVRKPSLNAQLNGMVAQLIAGMRYVFAKSGPLAASINHGGAFVRTRQDLDRPDQQLYFVPATYGNTAKVANPEKMIIDPFPGITISASPCRPTSRGHLEIVSARPEQAPSIHPNYLSTDEDVADALAGARFVRRLAKTPAMADLIEQELLPWPDDDDDEKAILRLRQTGRTTYHPTSTCMMGPDTQTAVVDAKLRVHGIGGLRVVDASIMPRMISGNTNACAIMIGERGADFILNDNK